MFRYYTVTDTQAKSVPLPTSLVVKEGVKYVFQIFLGNSRTIVGESNLIKLSDFLVVMVMLPVVSFQHRKFGVTSDIRKTCCICKLSIIYFRVRLEPNRFFNLNIIYFCS